MVKFEERPKPLVTIWHIPNELWSKLKSILDEHEPPKHTGRKRSDARATLDAIISHPSLM